MRLYFDPILARFIFIGFDADRGIIPGPRELSIDQNPINIFDDLEFVKEYVSELELITSEEYIEKIFYDLNKSITSALFKLNKTFPHVRYLKNEYFRSRQYIRNRLSPIDPVGINHIASTKFNEEILTLSLYSRNIFPIEINHLLIDNHLFKPIEDTILLGEKDGNPIYKKVIFKKITSNIENKKNITSSSPIEVNYNLYGSKVIRTSLVEPKKWFSSTDLNDKYIQKKANYKDYNFIKVDEKTKSINIQEGNWIIAKPLILPRNYKLIVEGGTTINLSEKGYILSQGPVLFNGTRESQIFLKGRNNGKGLIVTNSSELSKLNYVNFENLKNPDIISLAITGAVTFYNSPVTIINCVFSGTNSEDSLNLFRSNFKLSNTTFKDVYSDALDLDFSDGHIDKVSFENVGNDGLDLSGSNVEVVNLSFNKIKDKAISVGEKSNLNAKKIDIENSFIGIASKDNSKVRVRSLNTNNLDFCLAAYNKKPEFGEGNISIENELTTRDCYSKYLLEKGSSISVNSNKLSINSKDISKILYGN